MLKGRKDLVIEEECEEASVGYHHLGAPQRLIDVLCVGYAALMCSSADVASLLVTALQFTGLSAHGVTTASARWSPFHDRSTPPDHWAPIPEMELFGGAPTAAVSSSFKAAGYG